MAARIAEAKSQGVELLLFPELAVTGYPAEDLLLRPGFVRAAAINVSCSFFISMRPLFLDAIGNRPVTYTFPGKSCLTLCASAPAP